MLELTRCEGVGKQERPSYTLGEIDAVGNVYTTSHCAKCADFEPVELELANHRLCGASVGRMNHKSLHIYRRTCVSSLSNFDIRNAYAGQESVSSLPSPLH